MKKTIYMLCMLTFCLSGSSQSLFENALKIQRHIDNGKFGTAPADKDSILPLLQNNYFKGSVINSYARLEAIIRPGGPNENPYLYSLLPAEQGGEASASALAGGFNAELASAGGMDVTLFADALARFMVKRAKQELSITFFEKFKEDLNDPRFSDLRVLFPSTYKSLMAFDKEIYQYAAYITALREAFTKDLAQITLNIPRLWQQEKYVAFFRTRPEILETLKIMNELAAILKNGKHPGDAIHDIADLSSLPSPNAGIANYKNTFRLLDLVSQSFRSTIDGQYWMTASQIEPLILDVPLQKIYIGLLVEKERLYPQRIRFIVGGVSHTLNSLLISSAAAANIRPFTDFAYGAAQKIRVVQEKLNAIKESRKNKEKVDDQDLYDLFESFLNLAEHAFEIEKISVVSTAGFSIPGYYRTSLYVGKLANETYIDVAKKNYNSAIINTALIADTVLAVLKIRSRVTPLEAVLTLYKATGSLHVSNGKQAEVRRLIDDILAASTDKDKKNVYKDLNALLSFIGDSTLKNTLVEYVSILITERNESLKKLIRYGTFAANIASAKTAEEAEAAIEAIAMPAGSSRIKKQMQFSVSLNTYLGGFYGTNDLYRTGKGLTYGVIGLAGVSANWGFGKRNPWSLSIYGNIIDIGALAAFRVNNDTTEYKFKIKLNQIISPGGFLVIGLPNIPISILGGYQYAPIISSVTEEKYNTTSNRGRLTLGIAVDIPLLHLYNKTR